MKIVAIVSNIFMFAFTCIVLLTDGMPTNAAYIVFTLLLVLIPIFSLLVLSGSGVSDDAHKLAAERKPSGEAKRVIAFPSLRTAKILTIICNIVLLGFACWAIVNQYPHPEEFGVIPYEILVMVTPILSVLALSWRRASGQAT